MNSRNPKVMSLEEKVKMIRDFELISDIQERNYLRKSDPVIDSVVLNRRKILRQYSIMQTKLAAVKTVAVGFGGSKYKAEKQSMLERVICEWYQRAEVLLKPIKISESVFQEKVKMAMNILNIASLPASFSYVNFFKRCCFLARRNDLKKSKPTSLRSIIIELITKDGIDKEYALNIFGIDITADEEQVAKTEKKSLKEKVNIIQTYGRMNKDQQVSLKRKSAEISNIIENKSKILVQYNTMNAKLAIVEDQIKSTDNTEKFLLLLKIMVEWYLRADENPGAKGATISMIELREKTYTAFKMFRFTSLPSYVHWLNDLWKSCQEAKKKTAHEKKSTSLGLKVIAKYVLQREGVSEKVALSYFGIDITGEDEKITWKVQRIDNRTQASYLNMDENDASEGTETRMKGVDDFEAATCSTVSIQRTVLNDNEWTAEQDEDEDEEETFELYDVSGTESSDDYDATTSTEYVNYNNIIKEEFDISPQNELMQEDSPVSSTNASSAIKVYDVESQTAQDFSADTFIRPSVQDWLLQNGYEVAEEEDVQEDTSNPVKDEASSISPLMKDEYNLNDDENECTETFTVINKDVVKIEMTDDPYTVINQCQITKDRLTITAASPISNSVQKWLTNSEYDTTDDIQQEQSNSDSSLTLPIKATDRINIKVEDEDRISNPDNEDDESVEMIIFIDEDATEAEVMDDSTSANISKVTNESED